MKTILEAYANKIIEYKIPDKIYPKLKKYLEYYNTMNVFKNMAQVLTRLTPGEVRQIKIKIRDQDQIRGKHANTIIFDEIDDGKWKEFIHQ